MCITIIPIRQTIKQGNNMLDKRTLKLLDILNNECRDSGYKIFSLKELALMMPEYLKADISGIRECIFALSSREYISVKYEDDEEICLCPLPKGRMVFENRIDEEIEKHKSSVKYFIYSAIGALVGAVVGSGMITLILILFKGCANAL